jgi:hypothetical protein
VGGGFAIAPVYPITCALKEFDGHAVNWDLLMNRQRVYQEQEREAVEKWLRGCQFKSCFSGCSNE